MSGYDPEALPSVAENIIDAPYAVVVGLDRDEHGRPEGMGIGNGWDRWAGFLFLGDADQVQALQALAADQWQERADSYPVGVYPDPAMVPAVELYDNTSDQTGGAETVDIFRYHERAMRFGVDLHDRIRQALSLRWRTVFISGEREPVHELLAAAELRQIV